jgi:V-type H+-transporting ATPase subunit a
MKLAVIFGVAQMTLGVCLKGMNNLHHNKMIDFFFEFLPQLLLLLSLFGFMDLMIITKWLTNYQGNEHNAPSVIT